MNLEATLENLKAAKCRSAWDKGVKEYAFMLFNRIFLNFDDKEITNCQSLHEALLNGSKDWDSFSCGGGALVLAEDIAALLCTPSELKRCKDGMLKPNKQERWLDVQTRALVQAERLIQSCVRFESK